MKALGYIFLTLVVFFLCWLLGLAFGVFSLPFHAASNVVDTSHGIIDRTLNAENAIYNYEWFKARHEAIIAIDNKVKIAKGAVISFEASAGDRSSWTFEDKNEHARLTSIVQGLQSQQEDLIAEYNAKSKMANRAIFKDGLIPSFIEFGGRVL